MTDGSVANRATGARHVERDGHALELVLDWIFRPGDWAAALAQRLGLQGRMRSSTATVKIRPEFDEARAPLRLAFASDFHAGPTTDFHLLEDACERLASFNPDVLLLGGDFVSVRATDLERLAPLLAQIKAPLGKFAVLGNHDIRADHRAVATALERAGVQMVTNRNVRLPAPFDDITICGLDDVTRGDPRADLALDSAEGARIVLMHSPEGLRAIGDRRFDLALCGHTHGGQVIMPWGWPVFVPGGPLNRRYCSGRFGVGQEGNRTILVSRGVGCSMLPVRMFAPPEVHLCLIS